jgi:hypothetical protein
MSIKNSDEHIDTLHETLGFDIRDMTTKLYNIKRGSKIYGEKLALNSEDAKERVIIFDHIDGMYSYCEIQELDGDTTLNKDGSKAVVHLSCVTPLVAYKDGYRIYGGKYAHTL